QKVDESLPVSTPPKLGHGGTGAHLQQSTSEKQGTPWTGCQSTAAQHRDIQDKQPCTHSFTPKGNLERPINLIVMFLDLNLFNVKITH
ncbi:hypothetical protein GOODEAATRI_031005, partial [Goodea atripinnis]